jgi:hypothetical protein
VPIDVPFSRARHSLGADLLASVLEPVSLDALVELLEGVLLVDAKMR